VGVFFALALAIGGALAWEALRGPTSVISVEELQTRLQELDLLAYPELAPLREELRTSRAGRQITPEELFADLLPLLTHRSGLARGKAARALAEFTPERAIPYLIMALQFEQVFSGAENHLAALKEITGQQLTEWRQWYEWWWDPGGWKESGKRHTPPEGFSEWLISLYSTFIPSFKDFLYPGVARSIELQELMWGQVIKDEIEALDHPPLVSPIEAEDVLLDEEMVFGVHLNGEARAYPLRFMDVHELANDTVGSRPILISFCTLCGSAVLYDREVEGVVHSFGNSGLLFRGNKLMFDRETNSLWSNIWGKAVVGPLSEKVRELKRYPLDQTTWGQWKQLHPDTKVLLIRTAIRDKRLQIPGSDPYRPGEAYRDYRHSPDAIYPVTKRDDRLPPKSWVYGIVIQGQAKAYPMNLLNETRILNDALANTNVLLITERIADSTKDLWGMQGNVHAYARASHIFRLNESGALQDESGHLWERQEESLINPATGEKLPRLATGNKSFWFAWVEFYPATLLYEK